MKSYFIFNSKAKAGENEYTKDLIKLYCLKNNISYELFESEFKEEVQDYLKRLKNKEAICYGIGGDGTLNLILNGIINGSCSLGVLPLGSGNDFYRKVVKYPEEVIPTNVMQVNNLYGLNIFSLGIDAEICANAEIMKQRGVDSKNIYIASIIYTFFKNKRKNLKIEVDGNIYEIDANLLAICNGSFYGGGFEIAPKADIRTNEVLTYYLQDCKRFELLVFLISLLRGKQEKSLLSIDKAKNIKIWAIEPCIAQIDGEIFNTDYYEINTHAANINIVRNDELIRTLKK